MSERTNARPGEIGRCCGRSIVGGASVSRWAGAGATTRAVIVSGAGAAVVSVICPCAGRAAAVTAVSSVSSTAVAGECGNRTHPTRRNRVTPVLKTGETTRPHPLPEPMLRGHCRERQAVCCECISGQLEVNALPTADKSLLATPPPALTPGAASIDDDCKVLAGFDGSDLDCTGHSRKVLLDLRFRHSEKQPSRSLRI